MTDIILKESHVLIGAGKRFSMFLKLLFKETYGPCLNRVTLPKLQVPVDRENG